MALAIASALPIEEQEQERRSTWAHTVRSENVFQEHGGVPSLTSAYSQLLQGLAPELIEALADGIPIDADSPPSLCPSVPPSSFAPGVAELQQAEAAVREATRQCRELESELTALLHTEAAPQNPRSLNSISSRRAAGLPHFIPSSLHPFIDSQDIAAPPQKRRPSPEPTMADQLVELALSQFRFGRTPTDETFAVELAGPNIARLLRGGSDSLRTSLARRFHGTFGRTPTPAALTAAVSMLHAIAVDVPPEDVPLRVAPYS